jgi:histone-lysine N-methyltransferase SUV39H
MSRRKRLTSRYLFDCDGYQIANPPAGLDEVDSRLAVLARDSAARAAQAAADEDYPGTYNAYSSESSDPR